MIFKPGQLLIHEDSVGMIVKIEPKNGYNYIHVKYPSKEMYNKVQRARTSAPQPVARSVNTMIFYSDYLEKDIERGVFRIQ